VKEMYREWQASLEVKSALEHTRWQLRLNGKIVLLSDDIDD
jgi:hypothetical protein